MANKILKRRRKVPRFPRTDSHKKIRIQDKGWRKPKGRHNRRKRLHDYHGASPKIGYGTPRATKNANSKGLNIIEVANPKELEKIDAKTQAIKIKKIGARKKILIIKEAIAKKIKISNVRKPEEFISKNEKTKETQK